MSWLTVAVSSYLILAVVFLVDKYLLTKAIPNPKVYAFYVGLLGISVLALVPFLTKAGVDFYLPGKGQIALSLLAGAVFIYGLFWLYKTLRLFEASRVIPAIGGLTPLFAFGLIHLFTFGQELLSFNELAAFTFLVSGSVLITLEKEKLVNLKSLKFSALTAFLLALSFVLVKYVYMAQPFWNGFVWRTMGGFLMAICFFIFFPEIKKEIFKKKEKSSRKTAAVFLSNQAAGAGASILQQWAVFLAPLAHVPFVNALQGTQYAFLFVFALILSVRFPWILKEEVSQRIICQKIFAILLIGGGLFLLSI